MKFYILQSIYWLGNQCITYSLSIISAKAPPVLHTHACACTRAESVINALYLLMASSAALYFWLLNAEDCRWMDGTQLVILPWDIWLGTGSKQNAELDGRYVTQHHSPSSPTFSGEWLWLCFCTTDEFMCFPRSLCLGFSITGQTKKNVIYLSECFYSIFLCSIWTLSGLQCAKN